MAFDSCARFPDGVRSMAHYICGLAGEADAKQQRNTTNAAQKYFKNVASGLLKACRPMKMVYMGCGRGAGGEGEASRLAAYN